MGDIARCSLTDEDLLYRLFGVNAELLIDHAWGWEPCTMAEIKAYQPESKSIGSGQVLQSPYGYDKARLVVREMADQLALDLVGAGLVTDQLVLTVGYDIENMRGRGYQGEVTTPTAPPTWRSTPPPPGASSQRRWSSSTASSTGNCWCAGST